MEYLGCFSPSAQQPRGLGMVWLDTGGHAATAASHLGHLQLCFRIWTGFPSSPLPPQLPFATGHCVLHIEGQEDNSHVLNQELSLPRDDEKPHGNVQWTQPVMERRWDNAAFPSRQHIFSLQEAGEKEPRTRQAVSVKPKPSIQSDTFLF